MLHLYSFEKLDVWKESKELVKSIYNLTANFPDNEKFGLISQLNRAAISITSNIAEGNSRISSKEKSHFMTIAYSSLMEVTSLLIISFELKFIHESNYKSLRKDIELISNKLNALKNYHLKNIKK